MDELSPYVNKYHPYPSVEDRRKLFAMTNMIINNNTPNQLQPVANTPTMLQQFRARLPGNQQNYAGSYSPLQPSVNMYERMFASDVIVGDIIIVDGTQQLKVSEIQNVNDIGMGTVGADNRIFALLGVGGVWAGRETIATIPANYVVSVVSKAARSNA